MLPSDNSVTYGRSEYVTEYEPAEVRQHGTHEELLEQAEPAGRPHRAAALDAIIVPASRPAANIEHAIALASGIGCQLILLCSREARADEVRRVLAEWPSVDATVIDLPREYAHELFEFQTSSWSRKWLPKPCGIRDTDLSLKRNLGLILARILGWKRIFFLDDDIRGITGPDLLNAASMLGPFGTVGMRVEEFPDNSVMCHAHRETGGFQDVNVSGSALAVDCTAGIGFFPDIYNEDWLFFYKDAVRRRLGWSGHYATQLEYDPFEDPCRAARQEFGDMLAEGLYAQLHDQGNEYASDGYWSRFLQARRIFLDGIIDRLEVAEPSKQPRIREAVTTAQKCLKQIRPYHCEDYIAYWKDDLSLWDERLQELPALPTVKAALEYMRLAPAADGATRTTGRDSTERTAHPMVDVQVPAPPVPAVLPCRSAVSDSTAASPAQLGARVAGGYAREHAPVWKFRPARRLHEARRSRAAAPTADRLTPPPVDFVQLPRTGGFASLRPLDWIVFLIPWNRR
jgi:hypothetical protein